MADRLLAALARLLSSRILPRLAAGLVALAGVVLIVAGAVQAGNRAGTPAGTFTSSGRQPVVTAPGLLDLGGPRVTVQAGGSGGVFLGVARAADLEAFLSGAARTELIGYDGAGGITARSQGSGTLPDPSGSDIWVVSTRGQGSAALVWPDAPGQWLLLATGAKPGSGPRTVAITWTGGQQHSAVPELIAIGLLLLVAGGVTLALLWSRERLGTPAQEPDREPRHRETNGELRRPRERASRR